MDLEQILNNLIRIGKVSSVNPSGSKARVVFEDIDNMVTDELFIINKGVLGNKEYWIPQVQEEVLCIFLPIALEVGFIVGSYYNDMNLPPTDNKDTWLKEFINGEVLRYEDGILYINGFDNIEIKSQSTIRINAPAGVFIKGDLNVDGTINYSEDIHNTKVT